MALGRGGFRDSAPRLWEAGPAGAHGSRLGDGDTPARDGCCSWESLFIPVTSVQGCSLDGEAGSGHLWELDQASCTMC